MEEFAFNLYKRPSKLRQEAIDIFKARGDQAAMEFVQSLPEEDQQKLIQEALQAAVDAPLAFLLLRAANFSQC